MRKTKASKSQEVFRDIERIYRSDKMKISQNAICSVQSSPNTQVINAGTVIEVQILKKSDDRREQKT